MLAWHILTLAWHTPTLVHYLSEAHSSCKLGIFIDNIQLTLPLFFFLHAWYLYHKHHFWMISVLIIVLPGCAHHHICWTFWMRRCALDLFAACCGYVCAKRFPLDIVDIYVRRMCWMLWVCLCTLDVFAGCFRWTFIQST